ncbi:Innexin family-containing protein [Strongyloides ratti]|uniref:Innexin n=1 Tax=Strongyloides ratti TaxID=34506 RepID=A0A090KUD5_STRRB|nr:Innexin family-containing protein [Strongyloides ratti]CEF59480.1 Innexin family-containing protein [Strongyloides ratti]
MIHGVDKFLKRIRESEITNGVDKMNYLYTVLWLLLISSIGISRNMVGEPMQCWIANQVTRWESYIENNCYLRGGYRYHNKSINNIEEIEKIPVNYYAWVQPFNIFQAICFALPFLAWNFISIQSDFNPKTIVKRATIIKKNMKFLEFVQGNTMVIAQETVENLFKGLKKKSFYLENKKNNFFSQFIHRSYLTNCYIFFKFSNILNIILQIYLLCSFYSIPNFYNAGINVMFGNSDNSGIKIGNSPYFPRIITCNVTLHDVAYSTPTIVNDCVIRVNLYNEAFFIITWIWYVTLFITTITDFQAWIVNSYVTKVRNSFIKSHLMCRNVTLNDKEINKFIDSTFFTDGVTILRWIAAKSGSNFTSDIIHVAFQKYISDKKSDITLLDDNDPKHHKDELKLISGAMNGRKVQNRKYHSMVDNFLTIGNITFFIILATVIGSFTSSFKGVYCHTPLEILRGGWERYTSAQCFLNGKYGNPIEKKKFSMYYYIWTTYLIILPIVFFTIPRFYWSYVSKDYENGIKNLLMSSKNSANEFQKTIKEYFKKREAFEERKKIVQMNIEDIDNEKYLAFSRFRSNLEKNSIAQKYLYYKLMLFIASLILFWYVKHVFQIKSNYEAINYISKKLNDTKYDDPQLFPTKVWCEVIVNDIKYSRKQLSRFYCSMPYNYIYQIIFCILFIYTPFIIIISGCSFLSWLYALYNKPYRTNYFKNLLILINNEYIKDNYFYSFISHFSKTDYVFFELISEKISYAETALAIENVFHNYKKQYKITNNEINKENQSLI